MIVLTKSRTQADSKNSPKRRPAKSSAQIAHVQMEQVSDAVAVRHAIASPRSALHPGDILVLHRMVGNQVVQRILTAPMRRLVTTRATERPIVQRNIIHNFTNTETNKTVSLTITDSRIDANLSSHTEPWGFAEIYLKEDALHVKHIESHPQRGSGLGALFLFYSAKKALEAEKEIIRLDSATADEGRGFYLHMGFSYDQKEVREWAKAMKISEADVIKQKGDVLPLAGSALDILKEASKSFIKRWRPE